jgi:hypothetical protein
MHKIIITSLYILTAVLYCDCAKTPLPQKPNVIIVMTDDQGIGDLSCHGNPYLKTPNLDALHVTR